MLAPSLKFRWQLTLFALTALVILNILLRLHSLNAVLPGDNGVYAYIGHAVLQGERLYTDLVDNKPPAIYITYALAEKIWGYGMPAIINAGIFFSIVSMLFIFLILYRSYGKVPALMGVVFWVLASTAPAMDLDIPNTEFYVGAFVLISLWSFLEYLHGKKYLLWVTGGAMAIASAYKTNALFILLAFCAALLPDSFRRDKRVTLPLNRLGRLLLPGLFFWAVIGIYFYVQNRFTDFYAINFLAIRQYVGNLWLNEWSCLTSLKFVYSSFLKDVWILIVLGYVWLAFSLTGVFPKRFAYLYLSVFIGCLLMIGGIKSDISVPHYYQVLLPIFCLMAAMFYSDFSDLWHAKVKGKWIVLSVLFMISSLYLSYFQWKNYLHPSAGTAAKDNRRSEDDRRLGQLLKSLTQPDETLYQWGMAAGLYFYSERKAASGIVLNHVLYFAPTEVRTRLYNKLVLDIWKSKPAFIIFTSWAFRLDQEPWMQNFKGYYRFLGRFGKYVIFEKKGRAVPAKDLLPQFHIPPESQERPWENPQLVLFPGWRNIALLDPARFHGSPLLPSGNGPEARWIDEGLALFRQNQYIKGRDALAQALALNPKNLAAMAELGVYNEATAQYFLALGNYQAVAEHILHPFNEYYRETQNLLMQQAATFAPPDR